MILYNNKLLHAADLMTQLNFDLIRLPDNELTIRLMTTTQITACIVTCFRVFFIRQDTANQKHSMTSEKLCNSIVN
jgi:hypothetical protein